MKKLKTPKMAASHSLPLELITEILAKLPVKPLHRFKCVSKTWNSLITCSNFIKHHLRQTLTSNTNIITISNNSIHSSAISTGELRFDIVNHPLNNIPHSPPFEIVQSVHGVFLIVDSSNKVKTVCLFNPSNKTQRLVPPAPSQKPPRDFGIAEVFGFGYDSVTDDYKVVRLVHWRVFGFPDFEGSGVRRETSVYSMRNDSWESVIDETSVSYALQRINAFSVEEILYFIVISRDYKPVLKCFDLRTNTFSFVDYPDLDSYDLDMMTVSLRNLNGRLCFLVSYRKHKINPDTFRGNPLHNRQFLYADVWEMNECKWVKLFRIRKNEICKNCMYLKLITYSKDMKRVLFEVDGIWFGWYDLVTKRIDRVPVKGLRVEGSPYLACPYVETLVSVVNNKVVSEKERTKPKKNIEKNDFLRDSSLSCDN